MFENLREYKILLASKSPRRRELLQQIRLPFSVVSLGGVEEKYPQGLPAHQIPQYLSNLKSDAFMKSMHDNELIITADTLVILNGSVLGKPKNREEAVSMLRRLSGKTHLVITGVTISTLQKLAELSDSDIEYYVDNFLPYDKAGAYGIQEWIGCVAVEAIEGSFYNVMGLPVHQLIKELRAF